MNCSLLGLYRVPACDASLKCLLLLCFEKIRTKPSGAFMYKLLYVQVLEISHASKRGGTERLVSGSEISWNSISQFLFLISTSANKFVFSPWIILPSERQVNSNIFSWIYSSRNCAIFQHLSKRNIRCVPHHKFQSRFDWHRCSLKWAPA